MWAALPGHSALLCLLLYLFLHQYCVVPMTVDLQTLKSGFVSLNSCLYSHDNVGPFAFLCELQCQVDIIFVFTFMEKIRGNLFHECVIDFTQ